MSFHTQISVLFYIILDSVIRPQVHDGNIVIVSELKGEISQLKKTIAKKDVELIEKDKQVYIQL